MSTKTPSRALRRRPAPELHYFRTQVVHATYVTPQMVRITLGGADLSSFIWDGPDQRVKLFLPAPGQAEPQVPTGPNWYTEYLRLADDVRPIMRTYTVRGHRPERNEIEIDVVLHTSSLGPVSGWATRAQPGDHVGIYGPYAEYDPVPETDWQLLIGDETALPSIGGIIEQLPPDASAHAFIEVLDAAEEQQLESKGNVTVTWLHREAPANGSNSPLPEAVTSAALPSGRPYVWLAGEAGVVKTLRRHLVNERGYDRADIYFIGYWRQGKSEDQRAADDA